MSGWLAILSAKREEEARAWSRRNEEVGREEVGVFSTVATPVYLVRHDLSAGPRTDLIWSATHDLELKEFWTRSCKIGSMNICRG
jgi:hypothetical protein